MGLLLLGGVDMRLYANVYAFPQLMQGGEPACVGFLFFFRSSLYYLPFIMAAGSLFSASRSFHRVITMATASEWHRCIQRCSGLYLLYLDLCCTHSTTHSTNRGTHINTNECKHVCNLGMSTKTPAIATRIKS